LEYERFVIDIYAVRRKGHRVAAGSSKVRNPGGSDPSGARTKSAYLVELLRNGLIESDGSWSRIQLRDGERAEPDVFVAED